MPPTSNKFAKFNPAPVGSWAWVSIWDRLKSVVTLTVTIPVIACMVAQFYGCGFSLDPTQLPLPLLPSAFVSDDSFNLTRILYSDPGNFHVIVGSHGVGKTTAAYLAAAQASRSRAVVFLEEPPTSNEFFRLFYNSPDWLRYVTALLDFFTSVHRNSLRRFHEIISNNPTHLPILIIDNVEKSQNLGDLMHSAKQYCDKRLMKIVLVVSSDQSARNMNDYSARSRAKFEFFTGLSAFSAVQLLVKRGFNETMAEILVNQLHPLLHRLSNVPLENPLEYVQDVLKEDITDVQECIVSTNQLGNSNIIDETLKPCCNSLQKCLLTRNLLLYIHREPHLQFASKSSQQAMSIVAQQSGLIFNSSSTSIDFAWTNRDP